EVPRRAFRGEESRPASSERGCRARLAFVRGDSSSEDELQKHLGERGIATLIHYPVPPHASRAYAHLKISSESLPITTTAARTQLSLPIGPHLSDEAVSAVVAAVREFCERV